MRVRWDAPRWCSSQNKYCSINSKVRSRRLQYAENTLDGASSIYENARRARFTVFLNVKDGPGVCFRCRVHAAMINKLTHSGGNY